MEEQRGNGLTWALVGCGGLLFVGMCAGVGFGGLLVYRRASVPAPAPAMPDSPPAAPSVPSYVPPAPDKPPPPGQVPTIVAPAPPIVPQAPLVLTATVTRVTGALSTRVSRSCRFVVEPPVESGNCRTQITCDSILVYGGPDAGYFPCRFDSAQNLVSGADNDTTSVDRDAAMILDTTARTLQIRDDAAGAHGVFTIDASL